MSVALAAARPVQHPDAVTCACGRVVYDGEVIRSRCVNPHAGTALCRCKRWVDVRAPLTASSGNELRLSDKESRVDKVGLPLT